MEAGKKSKRFAHDAMKAMTPETREKGRQFVTALLDEGHDYRDMLNDVRVLAVLEVLDRSGNKQDGASKRLGISRGMMQAIMKLAGVKQTIVLERASA
jgi:predicted DNA-binding protein (UPF0251 family)